MIHRLYAKRMVGMLTALLLHPFTMSATTLTIYRFGQLNTFKDLITDDLQSGNRAHRLVNCLVNWLLNWLVNRLVN